jgi:hypothetical protein
MIAVFVNSMADTATFAPLFKDIEGISLYNPTRAELEKVLAENPTETLMCLGHGSPRGLFSADMHGFLLDRDNVHLLANRDIIGIWCYASDFARIHNLRGFFTYMFISNTQECLYNRCGSYDNEVVYEQNRLFAERVRGLITENRPMEEWVDYLYETCDYNLAFVDFNYSNLAYFDGESNYVPQSLLDEEREREQIAQAESYMFDNWEEGTLWHNVYDNLNEYIICYVNEIGDNVWEVIDGEDAMQERVCELEEIGIDFDDIMVFEKSSQL